MGKADFVVEDSQRLGNGHDIGSGVVQHLVQRGLRRLAASAADVALIRLGTKHSALP